MDDPNNIPNSNSKLAKRIGEQLRKGLPLSELDEPELKSLLEYKSQLTDETKTPTAANKESVWNEIQSGIQPVQAPRTFTRPSYRKVMWAVAASILIALLSSLFLFRQSDELEIIAQSHSGIETILLDDKSEVTLRPHSTLYQQSNNSGSRLYKLEGEGYFVVSENPDRIFSVQAGEGVVEVLGTRFNLREWGSQTEVFLEEGRVRLSLSDRSAEVELSPGQKSAILPNRQIANPAEADPDEITGWRNQKLVFQNRKAEELFNELEYHFNIQITAPREVMEERLGGAVSLEELDHCLNDLETVLNGEFIASGSNQYRFVSQE